jgi:ribosomal-protein-alanine N-acetyltransferase
LYTSIMDPIRTLRLELIPATADHVQAEIEDPARFFERLGVAAADDWPSENLQSVLPLFLDALQDPANVGWLAWYWIDRAENAIVGGGGFKGQPSDDGTAEIGYETRLAFRRRGYASEAVAALTHWALLRPGVRRVFAETKSDNTGSIGVLRATGFVEAGPGSEPGLVGFERAGDPSTKEA